MYYIGLMSGTSMDAIDAVLIDFTQQKINVIGYQQFPIPDPIKEQVLSITNNSSVNEVTRLDVIFGQLFAKAVSNLLESTKIDPKKIIAIGSHGQTVLHLPDDNYPRTLQIGDPSIIACHTGITTIGDFRRMDMAAGGQGAPLAPAFHLAHFHNKNKNRVILNIGGMANITVLPAKQEKSISGFDTGPGNALMDEWIRLNLQKKYDKDGKWAKSGKSISSLLDIFLSEPYLEKNPPKSTGKDLFNLGWLNQKIGLLKTQPDPADVQATLLEFSALSIAQAINSCTNEACEVLVCGGGIHNIALMDALKINLPEYEIASTSIMGIDPDSVEAVTFAWLAKCRLDQLPGNIPSVTGASKAVMLGAIYTP